MFDVIINDGSKKLPSDDIFYIIAKNGVFLKKTIGMMDALVPVNEISHLENVTPYVRMNMPKIPEKVFGEVVSFFKDVYEEYRSEAIVIIFTHRTTGEYMIHVPFQTVSGASAKYVRGTTIKDYLSVGTIHSHADFGAFHSGTDELDESGFDGFHATVGNVKSENPSIVASIVSNGFRHKVDPAEYIEGISEKVEVEEESKEDDVYYMYGVPIKRNKSSATKWKGNNKYYNVPLSETPDFWILQVEGTKYTTPIYSSRKDKDDDDNLFDDYMYFYDGSRLVKRPLHKREEKKSRYGDDWFLSDRDYGPKDKEGEKKKCSKPTPCDKCPFKDYNKGEER